MSSYRTLTAAVSAIALMGLATPAESDEPVTVTYVLYDSINNIGDPVMNVNFAEHMITKALFEPLVWDFDARTQDSSLRPTLPTGS